MLRRALFHSSIVKPNRGMRRSPTIADTRSCWGTRSGRRVSTVTRRAGSLSNSSGSRRRPIRPVPPVSSTCDGADVLAEQFMRVFGEPSPHRLSSIRITPVSRLPPKRHDQDFRKNDGKESLERWYADYDLVLRSVKPQCAVQPIPNGQTARPVAVRFALHDGVMNAVHARSDEQTNDAAFPCDRDRGVRVVKEDAHSERDLPKRKREWGQADD